MRYYCIEDKKIIRKSDANASITPLGVQRNQNPDLKESGSWIFLNAVMGVVCSYFLNFLRAPASPIKPVPKRSMVAGSGTALPPPAVVQIISSRALSRDWESLVG